MIPVKLQLRNFICYKDDVPTLWLDGVRIACLSGENGAGKSALLDAITWALWGKSSRSRYDDDLIHLGYEEMEVDLEFRLCADLFRVVRKRIRSVIGKPGKTSLELHQSTGGAFIAVTGSTIRETQSNINERLGMDFDTFINSAFLVQGRADEFTNKPPGERKELLAKLLNLSYYDSLEKLSKTERQTREDKIHGVEFALADLDSKLSRRDEYQARVAEISSTLAQTNAQIENLASDLSERKAEQLALQLKAQQKAGEERTFDQLQSTIDRLIEERSGIEKTVAGYEAAIEESDDVIKAYATLQSLTVQKNDLDQKALMHSRLGEKQANLRGAVALVKSKLESERVALADEATKLHKLLSGLPQAQSDFRETQLHIGRLAQVQQEVSAHRKSLEDIVGKVQKCNAQEQTLTEEGQAVKDRMERLKDGNGVCPLCGTILTDDRCEGVLEDYLRQLDTMRTRLLEIRREKTRLKEERAEIEANMKLGESQLEDIGPLENKSGSIRHSIDMASTASLSLPNVEADLAAIESVLTRKSYAEAEHEELASLTTSITDLAYDLEVHTLITDQHQKLLWAEPRHKELDEARILLAPAQMQLVQLDQQKNYEEAQASAVQSRISVLESELGDLPALNTRIAESEHVKAALDEKTGSMLKQLGAAQADLVALNEVAQRAKKLREDRKEAQLEKGIYEELAAAFGKKGIQAMIIKSATPEIEDDANKLLAKMSDNRMHVKLETQKSGSLTETLEIKVSDELGTRGYETFSGGEAFRVNLALRIALSRLLARRAGAPLPTLFIDEGFGTQDVVGRDKIVEALTAIQDEFEQILVITHIDELKEQFPVRIEVTKGIEGSTFTMI